MSPEPFTKAAQLSRGPRRVFRCRATPTEWDELRRLKLDGRCCRVCGNLPARWAKSLHHIVPRSLGGDDVADNLVCLCGDGTSGCHGLVEGRHAASLAALAANLDDSEYAYVVAKLGEGAMHRLFGV